MTREEENKLIERTAKHDAYQAVWLWISTQKDRPTPVYGDAEWYAKEKMENHAEWLAEQEYEYCYAPSGIVKKVKDPLGSEEKK